MSKLFEPFDLRSVHLDNRIVVSPMCQYSARNGVGNEWHVVNLGQYALSGPALVFFEATHVNAEGRITPQCLGLYGDAHEAAMKRVVEFIKTWTKSAVGVQLAHAGRKGSRVAPWHGDHPATGRDAWQTVAPSAIAYADWQMPRALDNAGLQNVRDSFAAAAKRSHRIGIDVAELHFAHGYLAHQFLSPLSNRRIDDYGGTLENRMRFPLELFDVVRAVWPASKPLGVRISATDWVKGGWDLDSSIVFAQALKERGCDFIDVSSGGLSPEQQIEIGPGYQVPFARAIKEATGIPTIAVGMITEPAHAESILEAGDADFVALARGSIRNPRWTWDAADELGGTAFVPSQYLRGRNKH